jgi:hypothetical protein
MDSVLALGNQLKNKWSAKKSDLEALHYVSITKQEQQLLVELLVAFMMFSAPNAK